MFYINFKENFVICVKSKWDSSARVKRPETDCVLSPCMTMAGSIRVLPLQAFKAWIWANLLIRNVTCSNKRNLASYDTNCVNISSFNLKRFYVWLFLTVILNELFLFAEQVHLM